MNCTSICILALAFCGWATYLGGLSAYDNYNCNVDGADTSAQVKCARAYSWPWWILFFEFFVLVAAVVCSLCPKKHESSKVALGMFFAMTSVLLMEIINDTLPAVWTYMDMDSVPSDQMKFYHSVRAIVAGCVICVVFNFAWIGACVGGNGECGTKSCGANNNAQVDLESGKK